MPLLEIRALYQAQHYDEALALALQEYEASPEATWVKNNLVWPYFYVLRKCCDEGNGSAFFSHFQRMMEIDIQNEGGQMLAESLGWKIIRLMNSLLSHTPQTEVGDLAQRFFECCKYLQHTPRPGQLYSALFATFCRYSDHWDGFHEFCQWWDFANFRPEDYVPETLPSGQRMPLSLVERGYMNQAKCLIRIKDTESIARFLPDMEDLHEQHPEMMYIGYYIGKLLQCVGADTAQQLDAVLPFIRKKKSEFWAWQQMAEILHDQPQDRLACLLRGFISKTPPEFLVRLEEELAATLIERGNYNEARFVIERYLDTKQRTNTRPSYRVTDWTRCSWYATAHPVSPKRLLDFIGITESLLYHDVEEQTAVVTHVNTEKNFVSLLIGYQQRTFCRLPKGKVAKRGDVWLVRLQMAEKEGAPAILLTSRACDEIPQTNWLRIVTGPLKSAGRSFFIRNTYIEKEEVARSGAAVGATISCIGYYNYNPHKEQWAWTSYKILPMQP